MGRDAELGPYLRFKKKYLEGILAGRKRVTVRYGIVRPRFSLVYIVCCNEIYGEAVITRVYYTRLDKISQDVVEAEGFESREELVNELREIYGEVRDGDTVSVIFFNLIRKYDKPVPLPRPGGGV